MNYYCLIAGLPDLVEDTKNSISISELKSELYEQLSSDDWQLLKVLFASYDNENLLAYLANKEANLNSLGNLTATDWEELLSLTSETDNPADIRLNGYVKTFLQTIKTDNTATEGISETDLLTSLYYKEAISNKNAFLSSWFEFNLNVNNILTAITCRKHGYNIQNAIIGDNEIATTIRQSHSRDFGLNGIFADFELINKIAEETDLLEREKKLDALKWAWLEEATFFNYFSVEKVIAYLIKVQLIDRWKLLSIEKGTEIFREMVGELKKGISFENLK